MKTEREQRGREGGRDRGREEDGKGGICAFDQLASALPAHPAVPGSTQRSPAHSDQRMSAGWRMFLTAHGFTLEQNERLQWGFPGGASGRKKPACQCRRRKRRGFDPWVGRIPWRRAWLPTPVFFPGGAHGQRSLAGYGPWRWGVGCHKVQTQVK